MTTHKPKTSPKVPSTIKSELNTVVIAPAHHDKPKSHHTHKRLHGHHQSMHYLAAAGMTALGLFLLVAFNPATPTILQAPAGSISEDVTKVMPALEPDLNGFGDTGISAAELDEAVLGQ